MSKVNNSEAQQGQMKGITLDHRLFYTQGDVEKILTYLGVQYHYSPKPAEPPRRRDEPAWDSGGSSAKMAPGQYSQEDVVRLAIQVDLSALHRSGFKSLKVAIN